MSEEKPAAKIFPSAEYAIITGVAVSASGRLLELVFIVILYFLLKRQKPIADFEVLLVSSIYAGIAFAEVLKIALNPQLYRAERFWEPICVTAVTLALFYTGKRTWAWLLLVYSGVVGVLCLLLAAIKSSKGAPARFDFFYALLSFMLLWLLVHWLRKKVPAQPVKQEAGQ